MFAVEDIEDVLARLHAHGAELVGELVQYEDSYRLCYVRGPGMFSPQPKQDRDRRRRRAGREQGPRRRWGRPRSGGGHGLIGIRERATLPGGDLDTERDNGRLRVRARIPYVGRHT
jgi:hypothetical protein